MEDADFIMNYLIHSERNIYIDVLIYGYRKHIGAATGKRKDYNNDLKLIINHLYLITRNIVRWIKHTTYPELNMVQYYINMLKEN